ncbi:hypothetical protein CCS01_04750 [Rhodopila globiformis]|uniref:Uncharacterized protein n=1 Tax=Rhodopila globiformis TaxID=1071 RepID=A0A2S6NM79_RHOGL|nr:hypothetical protein CCS01_04750 [Rhodopila globiformis]
MPRAEIDTPFGTTAAGPLRMRAEARQVPVTGRDREELWLRNRPCRCTPRSPVRCGGSGRPA